MRKKLLFGMIALLALVAALGERYFNRAVGQDIPLPKAAEPEKKDLFDLLKKDLEGKKDEPTFPALPAKNDVDSKKEPTFPSLPPLKKDEALVPPMLPALPASKDEKVLITPPPVGDAPKTTIPRVVSEKPVETPKRDFPPLEGQKKDSLPVFDGGTPQPVIPPHIDTSEKPMAKPASPPSAPLIPLSASDLPSNKVDVKPNTVPQAVTLPKNSPWSLNVVMVDGQTIVTAVVNKKHEFKILCQTLDLQTGKGTLKASGKVQINGDALNGTCDHLSITLLEDRLLLEGKALVSIDRTSANVSDTAPASFELKGETLNLRISELQTTAYAEQRSVDARPVSRSEPPSRVVTASMKLDGTQWTPYGRLRAMKSNDQMWSLESSNGTVIAYVLAREGGTLERYVGQNISVYGTREREHSGQPVLRATHIALP